MLLNGCNAIVRVDAPGTIIAPGHGLRELERWHEYTIRSTCSLYRWQSLMALTTSQAALHARRWGVVISPSIHEKVYMIVSVGAVPDILY